MKHGTANAYNNLGCRCAKCREAWRVYYMTRRPCPRCSGPKSWARELCANCSPSRQIKHGGMSRYKKGCRCGLCVANARALWAAEKAVQRRRDPLFRQAENLARTERRRKARAAA